MRVSRFFLSSAAACFLSLPALAEPSIAELDQRVRALEAAVQTLTQLLQAQQGAASVTGATSENGQQAAAIPAGYQMGALYLDLYTASVTDDETNKMARDASNLADGPEGPAAGSALLKAPATFDYGSFAKDSSLASFRTFAGNVGVHWNGFLLVEKAGDYTFSVTLTKKDSGTLPSAAACRSVLRISDEIVADAKGTYRIQGDRVDMDQSTQTLTEGVYSFSLWTTCLRRDNNRSFDLVSTSVGLAAPGDRAPKPISPERFGVQP